ncbi:outer membrane protein assembly factor BamD [Draconibacterium halophilum]|uniref:Outer membrane protein assembly factor BamD n=1 Tax=Draconibacterium halophilum TaxID=2706887 RepID=A0A6C0REU2_9BACT|nr:outer membrane protein assembly factor BamD [Draconibacterium halophilum]QIA08466.1 outer membrane protein assembly factor BamD [Draconibacterium halophilum]
MRFLGIGLLAILMITASCGDYNKIVKSTDYEFKYKKAVEYYEDGEYVRASTLFRELVNIYRGTSRADKIYYFYAKSMIGQKDYLMAGHYFKSLVKEFPTSEYVEEAQFMIGYCAYLMSPKPRLDQQVTQQAIDALQLYNNLYPYSDRVEEANRLIDELVDKLVYKSYLSAKLYYDFEQYKAAVIALRNSLEKYPDSKYREELKYMLLKSKYLLASKSVLDKQNERYTNALDEYFSFIDEYPDSDYKKEVNKFYEKASEILNYKEEEDLNIN